MRIVSPGKKKCGRSLMNVADRIVVAVGVFILGMAVICVL